VDVCIVQAIQGSPAKMHAFQRGAATTGGWASTGHGDTCDDDRVSCVPSQQPRYPAQLATGGHWFEILAGAALTPLWTRDAEEQLVGTRIPSPYVPSCVIRESTSRWTIHSSTLDCPFLCGAGVTGRVRVFLQ
jgi:hypothetical protein